MSRPVFAAVPSHLILVAQSFVTTKSDAIFEEAQDLMPGGVSSPVRAFQSVGGNPIVVDHVMGITVSKIIATQPCIKPYVISGCVL